MKLTIEIPDPPEGCDPAAVQWGRPPLGALILVAHMGCQIWRKHDYQTHGETAWVMPYTPGFLGLLLPGWVTYDFSSEWVWWSKKPEFACDGWTTATTARILPFREVPPISGEQAIWEVPND
jgi:hypothetical protein